MQDGKSQDRASRAARGGVLCIGGAVVDLTYVARSRLRPGTSNPASGSRAFGGVARNVAVNLVRLGVATSLLSVVGQDESGRAIVKDLRRIGVSVDGLRLLPGTRTAEYVAVLEPDGSLALGIADMAIFDRLDRRELDHALAAGVEWIFADCNCPAGVLASLIAQGQAGTRLAIDAVSTPKVERLPERLEGLDLLFLNLDEAAALLRVDATTLTPEHAIAGLRDRGVSSVVLTLGDAGLRLGTRSGDVLQIPALPTRIVDVTGAGDALIAGCLAGLISGAALPEAAQLGTAAAALTLSHAGSTVPDLSLDRLTTLLAPPPRVPDTRP